MFVKVFREDLSGMLFFGPFICLLASGIFLDIFEPRSIESLFCVMFCSMSVGVYLTDKFLKMID
jgi:hypothetical protein